MSAATEALDGAQAAENPVAARQGAESAPGPQTTAQVPGAAPVEESTVESSPPREQGTWTVPVTAGLGLAGATAALGWFTGWPAWAAALAGVAAFGLGVLAVLDRRTMLVRNRHNGWFFAVSVVLAGAASVMLGDWVPPLFALASAVFGVVYLFVLSVAVPVVGMGDVKLSASPALLLGVFNPLAAVLWLLGAFILAFGIGVYLKIADATGRRAGKSKKVPFVPLMALGILPAVPATGLFMSSIGLL